MPNIVSMLVLGSIILCLFAIYKYLIYPAYISPLAKIPTPHFTCSFSRIWILYSRYQCRENRTILAAHEKFGPVLRLGPNEISVCGIDGGLRTVYGGGFEKADWYNVFGHYGVPNMFSTPHAKPHSAIKKMVSNVYSKSYIASSPAVHDQTATILYKRLLPILSAAADSNAHVEVVETFFATTMDFITAFLFGLQCGSNFLIDEKTRKHFLKCRHDLKGNTFWQQELPGLTRFAQALGMALVSQKSAEANTWIETWCLGMCDAASKLMLASKASIGDEPIVYGALVTHGQKETLKVTSPLQSTFLADQRFGRASEVLDHLNAGFETSGITLTYLTHELSLQPALQARLRAELLALKTPLIYPPISSMEKSDIPLANYKEVDALPILHAILMETLRLHAPIPGIQPRVTPAVTGGTTLGTGAYTYSRIPAGVRVQASAHALHRNKTAFPNPELFQYERWLDSKESVAETKDENGVTKERAYWAFGSGGRMCLGSNFAIHELKMVIAAIYTNFTTSIVDDEGIEQLDGYTVGPRSGRLVLQFEEIAKS